MMRVQERKGGKEMKRLRGLSDTEDSCMRRLVREWRALLSLWSHRAPSRLSYLLLARINHHRSCVACIFLLFSDVFHCFILSTCFHIFTGSGPSRSVYQPIPTATLTDTRDEIRSQHTTLETSPTRHSDSRRLYSRATTPSLACVPLCPHQRRTRHARAAAA